jgi:serine-type D-Ala-D-Ala carboxypeptidase/endopeptidase
MPDNFRPSNPANPYADYTVAQMFDFLGRYQLTRDIGAEFEYSNFGVALLGEALSRRTGKTYEALSGSGFSIRCAWTIPESR